MSLISIIIPTRNRCDLLAIAVRKSIAIAEADGNAEVIVVDNGSTDGTKALCEELQKKSLHFRYIYDPRPGLHTGRHAGMREAKGDILVFADDDIEPMTTWLQAIHESFKDENVIMVGGKCLPKFEENPPEWLSAMWVPNAQVERVLGSLSLIDLGDEVKVVNPFYVFGCNFAIRRSALLEADGFHPDGMPQELIRFRGDGESHVSNIILNKGYKVLYHPLASVYHYVPKARMTEEYFCQRAYNQGVSDSYTAIRKYGGLDSISHKDGSKHQEQKRNFFQRVCNKPLQEIPYAILNRVRRHTMKTTQPPVVKIEEPPFADLHRKIAASYKEGYSYHQEQVKQSPELLKWVLRENYWDCQLPSMTELI